MGFAYMAAIFKSQGHIVDYLTNEIPNSDIAFISSSRVDYRNEILWAKKLQTAGVKVYFIGIFSSNKLELFLPYCTGIIEGEPEEACYRLAQGKLLAGVILSSFVKDLESLPFPDWDIFPHKIFSYILALKDRPIFPIFPIRCLNFIGNTS